MSVALHVNGPCLPTDNFGFLSAELARHMSQKPKPVISLKIIPAQIEDATRILKFLQKNFYPDEPLSCAQNRMPRTIQEVMPMRYLSHGHSYLATNALDNSENNIVGVVLNGEADSSELATLDKLVEKHKGTKFAVVLKFLRKVEYEAKLWEKIKTEKVFKTFIIAVSGGHRGQRIGQRLMEYSQQRASSCGYSHMSVDCTSFYSASLMESIGFSCVYELPYDEYLDDNGEVIFKTKHPHVAVKLLVKDLQVLR